MGSNRPDEVTKRLGSRLSGGFSDIRSRLEQARNLLSGFANLTATAHHFEISIVQH